MKHVYSNPRMEAVIPDWPSGSQRVQARFWIEQTPKGERAWRQTTGAPKTVTFYTKMRIVDGDDGRTYLARLSHWGHISILRGDMKYEEETVFDRDEGYSAALALFEPVEA